MDDDEIQRQREALAAEFDRELDPLARFEAGLRRQDVDPFALYWAEVLAPKQLADRTEEKYRRVFEQWQAYMEEVGRHPACPSEQQVKQWIRREQEKGNDGRTIRRKLYTLSGAYRFWQEDAALPHPRDVNPFQSALQKSALSDPEEKRPPWLDEAEVREYVTSIKHIRDRLIVVLGFKLGLRASEIANIELADVHVANADIQAFYDDLGRAVQLDGRRNAISIPHDREGNKSKRPRVLPLDEEVRMLLKFYLMIRPDTGAPWLLLSKNEHTKITNQAVNAIWTETFQPEYAESERYKAITSHYGRHYFSTYWTKHVGLDRDLVKYMRGDKLGEEFSNRAEAIDSYIHTYYADIEDVYRQEVFKVL